MVKEKKGITIISLVITIILLLILASVSVYTGINITGDVKEEKLVSELNIIQHAILKEYTKYNLTGNDAILKGTKMTYSEVSSIIEQINQKSQNAEIITLQQADYDSIENLSAYESYYKLLPTQLDELDITNTEDTYIVNYKTGEVINYTQLVTKNGTPLYTYAISQDIN